MNLQQLQALILSECLAEVSARIILPEGESPSQAQLEAEFIIYKQELIDKEEARLAEIARLEDLNSRFSELSDHGLLQGALGISNIALHFRDNVLNADAEQAEQNMLIMESAYDQSMAEINADAWLRNRQIEYAKIDNMLLEGLAEDAAGRPEKLQEYLALREQIRLAHPKPE